MKEDLRQHTVCFTGHRELRHHNIPERLDTLLENLIQQGYRYYGAGGALRFDTEAALSVLRTKERYPHIKLIIVLPFSEQAKSWAKSEQAIYERIKAAADKTVYTGDRYSRVCYHIRNRALVDGSSFCVCYMYKNTGGTTYTVGYARRQGLQVINIAE